MTRLPAAGQVHRVRLQFGAVGPAVIGEWADGATAHRAWHSWVGLYGSDQSVVIRLAREAGGSEDVLMAWENGHAAERRDGGGKVRLFSGVAQGWQ
ncbi:hypothetical protein [Streptomyces sp. NPDC004629]|uniref:hypothetical protein n=1 Tax=Streptomyces sp. NPDC004629 TaxID=3364705 RepID=UPI003692E692